LKTNQKLAYAVLAALSAGATGSTAYAATEETKASGLEIADIVVTAQRRSESVQNVPITIQALSSETLSQLSVTTFDDMVKYLPNVQLSTNGPGQGNIFMRGLALGSAGTQSSGTIGLYPNVAVYLDDQSGQLPGRNLDVYAADLERVEVLEGPQGTIFGGGAEAGVLRYITNKPKLNKTEGNFEATYGTTAHGDPNSGFTAVLNLPLITDTLAVRAVMYNETRGGYINNVPSTFTRRNTDLGIYYANNPGGGVPADSVVINNNAIAKNAINPVKYQGTRISALWNINDDWNVLVSQSYQNIEADGVFYQMPKGSEGQSLNPLEVTLFNPSYNKDKFSNTAWTVNGKIGDLKAVYTGGYLVRTVDQVQDYTNYARGVYADYYQCYGPGSGVYSAAAGYAIYGTGDTKLTSKCFSPSSTWREQERNEHTTHEFRLSTPDDWRMRAIGGAYYENLRIYDQTDWYYKSIPNCPAGVVPGTGYGCMGNVATIPGTTVNNPGTRNDNDGFFEDVQRGYKQTAFFASVDYDLIPKVLTATVGARHYKYELDQKGTVATSFGCFENTSGCYAYSHNMDAEHLNSTYSGTTKRANLTWHVTSDAMVYGTWSQGYRPGGFNRTTGKALYEAIDNGNGTYSKGPAQYLKPLTFAPDQLENKEVGFKTQFFNHRLQVNGSVYQEDWKNVQTGLFNPGVLGNLTLAVNGADYRVKGFELQTTARVTEGLTVTGALSYNDAVQTNSPCLQVNNPALGSLVGSCISTYFKGGTAKTVTNALGNPGTPTAYSPKVQFSLHGRYDWTVGNYNAFWQVGMTHVGDMYNNTNTDPSVNGDDPTKITYINTTLFRFHMASYNTFDASVGVTKDNWNVQLFGQNLTDENASTFTSTAQFIKTEVPLRPRVLGVKVGMKF
jgi:outer membrane receptor protein involved in Fe transport